MGSEIHQRFPILFDKWYAILSSVLFIAPSRSYIEIDGNRVCVRMDWAFRSSFPKSAVVAVTQTDKHPLSRGVHGFAGRWLVNGSGRGILAIDLTPGQRGYVMGFPVSLRQLMVSVSDPAALMAILTLKPEQGKNQS